MKIKKELIYIFLIVFLILINYINIFQNEFAWDDHNFILDNKKITSFKYIPYYFTHESQNSLWRPLRETLYIITYSVWGLNSFGYHLNSILLHSLAAIIIFLIIAKILNKEIALFTALLFAVHPVQTARVTNMTATFDILGIVFYLLAFYLFVRFRDDNKKKYFYYSILVYILALLSSEEAITFIGVIFLYDFCFKYKFSLGNIKKILKQHTPYIVVSIIYIILHVLIVKRVGRELGYFGDSFKVALLTTIKAVVNYIILLIYPKSLSVYRSLPKATSVFSINFIISLLILVLIIFLFIKSYKKSKIVFFSIGWFFITMFLFYNFVPKSTLIADRYLYLPSLGFCLLLGYLIYNIRNINFLKNIKNKKIILIIILMMILTSYSVLTINRNTDWRNDEILLKKSIEVSPLSTRAHWQTGVLYRDNGDYENAELHLKKAIELSSKNYEAMEDLGVLYAQTEKYDLAILNFKLAISTYPSYKGGYYKAHNDLGLVYSMMGMVNESIIELKKAIEIHPEFSKAHNDIATVYAKIGELELAEAEFKKAIELNPDEESYRKNLNTLHAFLNNS